LFCFCGIVRRIPAGLIVPKSGEFGEDERMFLFAKEQYWTSFIGAATAWCGLATRALFIGGFSIAVVRAD
jgi:hypothetical protein